MRRPSFVEDYHKFHCKACATGQLSLGVFPQPAIVYYFLASIANYCRLHLRSVNSFRYNMLSLKASFGWAPTILQPPNSRRQSMSPFFRGWTTSGISTLRSHSAIEASNLTPVYALLGLPLNRESLQPYLQPCVVSPSQSDDSCTDEGERTPPSQLLA